MPEEEIEVNTKQIVKFFKEKKSIIIYASLAVLMILAFLSRTQNVKFLDHKYLLSPDDPYYFYRMSMYIATHGHIMANDTMRYYPIGFSTERSNLGTAYLAGYMYRFLHSIGWKGNMFDIAAYYAPILLAIGLIPFFFLVREVFNEKSAIIATGILAFSNGILFRTMGGFLEKEPLFWPLFVTSLLFIILSIKRKKWYYALIGGLFTTLAGFSSGLFQYIVFIYSFYTVFEVLLDRMDKNKLINFIVWFLSLGLTLPLILHKYGNIFHFWFSIVGLIPEATIVVSLIPILLSRYKDKIPKKIPAGFVWITIGILISIGVGYGLLHSKFVHILQILISKLSNPLVTSAFASSVSENQPPTFFGGSGWWRTYNFSLITFFIGLVVVFGKSFRSKDKNLRYIVVGGFTLFILGLILDHFSGNTSGFIDMIFRFQPLYWGIFIVSLLYYLIKEEGKEFVKEIKPEWLFLISFAIFAIIMAHGAVRLFFMLTFPVAILSGYFFTWVATKYKSKDMVPIATYSIAGIYILFLMYSAFTISSHMNPGLGDWYQAMYWIRNNTPKNAVFTHWWDYGYLVQAIGQRATVVDPGNFIVKRDYDTGGHLFCAYNMSEVKRYIDKYHPNYWLICSEDILKYYQISRLGSLAQNASGRTAYLSVYAMVSQQDVSRNFLNTNGSYLLILRPITGYQLLFKDFSYQGYIFNGNDTFIYSILIPADQNRTYWPWAQIVDQYKNTATLPVKCYCEMNKGCLVRNDTSIPICVEPMRGGYLLFPIKMKDMLFTKLYLLNETIPGFKLVYDGPKPLDVYTILGHGTNVKIYQLNWSEIK